MIVPFQKDDALLRDIRRSEDAAGFRLWWLGQSGYLLQWQRQHLLLDPYLSDSLTKKYEKTDKPHVRMTERAIAPERLSFVNAVTSSHNHTDHLDAETLKPLFAANPHLKFIIPEANRSFVTERLSIDALRPIGLNDGGSAYASGFEIIGVTSAHETIDRDESGRSKYLGYVIRFGEWTIYHSGDTVLFPGMVEQLRKFKIDVALLPINGADPARRVAGNLNGTEAARLAHQIGARVVIPCHYEMFEFNTASPHEFTLECRRAGQNYRVLRCGERFGSSELP
jgi:L-ascorbate metabolism protein UlaG (beta-lactamase superfamily)